MMKVADVLGSIVACPTCRSSLQLTEGKDTRCSRCKTSYRWLASTWDLRPQNWKESSTQWETWEQLQHNGLVSYTQDPDHNLGVGKRQDYLKFGTFCKFAGYVLDVGCGPQKWPTHFTGAADGTVFVGVDPLVGTDKADYAQICALGEFLPFVDQAFDHVVFATSLDHFIDPLQPLMEARRVCKQNGEIDIWIGEKDPKAPRPPTSPAWYAGLKKPDAAEDVFHLKRLKKSDLDRCIEKAQIRVEESQAHPIDAFRTNYFYRLRI